MSYITSQLGCNECGFEMNVAFGIQGSTIIAQHPRECPKCKSEQLLEIAHGWKMNGELDWSDKTKVTDCEECRRTQFFADWNYSNHNKGCSKYEPFVIQDERERERKRQEDIERWRAAQRQ